MAGSFGMTNSPGAGNNFAGTNVAVPTPASNTTPAIGGGNNPFLPTPVTGQAVPGQTSPMNASATGFDVSSLLGFGNGTSNPLHDITKALGKAGFSAGVAGELADFLSKGAGFNPDVANALIAAMQPQVQQQEADLLEQFGGMGLRGGSPAAYAMSNYLGQVQLNEGQIWAGLYEQSVQNYMNVLLSGKGNPPANTFQNMLSFLNASGNAATGAGNLAKGLG